MKLKKISLALAAAGMLIWGAQAQSMTLQEFVADSVQSHPDVREQVHYFRQVVQEQAIAGSGWRPRVDLDASSGRYWTKSPATQQQREDYNSSRGSLTLTQNLFSGFDTTAQIAQNDARLEAAKYMLLHEAYGVALEAVQVYLEVIKQARLLELAEQNVATHEEILVSIEDRYSSGVGRRSELEQTQGRVARAHASLIAQQNNLHDALTMAHRVLGRYVDASEIYDPEVPVPQAAEVEELIERALKEHPSLRVATHNIDASLAEHRRSRSANYPQIDLILQKHIGDNINGLDGRTDEHSALINLRYNLYRGGADLATQRRSISAVHQQQASSDRVRRQLIESVRFAAIADTALHRQLEQLEVHYDMASQTAESFREEFLIGQRNLLDVLDAENERNTAHNRLVEAGYDAVQARYRVYESGGLLFDTLKLDVSVDDDDLQIIALQANLRDELPLNPDRDSDYRVQVLDECDNTRAGETVDQYGCAQRVRPEFGYVRVAAEEPSLSTDSSPFMVERLEFLFDQTELTEDSRRLMSTIVQRLQDVDSGYRIEIQAHTDATGSAVYNEQLSQRRAQALRNILLEAGIPGERLIPVGLGAAHPIADNNTAEGRARNRRVEFYLREDG